MALNYFFEYNDRSDNKWRLEIDNPDFAGNPIELIPSENPIIISYNGNSDDDIFKMHVISSSVTITVVSTDVDFDTLMYINDASFKCRVYRSGNLFWSGYLTSDDIQEVDSGVPYDVVLKAIDGLEVLSNIEYNLANYPSVVVNGQESALRSPMNSFRSAFYRQDNLDLRLPIRWNTSLKNDAYPSDDMLAGRSVINPFGDLRDYDVFWWLSNIAKSALSWVYQKSGYWYINNYFDTFGGNFSGWEITSDTSAVQVAQVYDESEVTQLEMSDTVNENWFWFGKKPFGKVEVLYNDTKFPDDNVLPNGGFDIVSTDVPMYWHRKTGEASLVNDDPINGRNEGWSLRVRNITSSEDWVILDPIPIDTETLFKDCTIGFIWSPVGGYELNANQNIDFSKFPIHVVVKLDIGGQEYYLNEFGFWSDKNLEPGAWVSSYDWHSSGGGTFSVIFDQNRDFEVGDEFIIFLVRDGQLSYHSVVFNDPMSLQDGVEHIANTIGNASSPNNWTVSFFGVDNTVTNHAFTAKVNDYYRKIELAPEGPLKYGDILLWQFQSRGTAGNIKIPAGRGFLTFEIYSHPNSEMLLDDAYFTVENAHDVYEVSVPQSRNSKETYEMGISSGFSGNMVSSYGSRYNVVNESELWGGMTLTERYGRAVMDVRNAPRRVFSGSIDRLMEFGMFSLGGKVYAPLSMNIDCKDLITDVVGFEFNPNPVGYGITHKSSE